MSAHYAAVGQDRPRALGESPQGQRRRPAHPDQPDGLLGDVAQAKQQLSRATRALPNGYCQLPLVKTCPHAKP